MSGSRSVALFAAALLVGGAITTPADELDLDLAVRATMVGTIGPAGAALDLGYPLELSLRAQLSPLMSVEADVETGGSGGLFTFSLGSVHLRLADRLMLSAGRQQVTSGVGTEFSVTNLLLPIDCDSVWSEPSACPVSQDLLSVSWRSDLLAVSLLAVPRYRFGGIPSATGAWASHQGIPSTFEFPPGTIRTLNAVVVEPMASPGDGLGGAAILGTAELTLERFSSQVLFYAGRDRAPSTLFIYDYPIIPYEFDCRLAIVPTEVLLGGVAAAYHGSTFECWLGAVFGRRDRLVASQFHAEQGPTPMRTWVTYQEIAGVFALSPTAGVRLAGDRLQATAEVSFELVPGDHPKVAFPPLSRVAVATIAWQQGAGNGRTLMLESRIVANLDDGLTVVKPRAAVDFGGGMETYLAGAFPLSPFGLVSPGPGSEGTVTIGVEYRAALR